MKFVILAGGSGKRLWPLSTLKQPKQFQSFLSEKTLFQQAIERVSFLNPEDIYIATNQDLIHHVKEQAPQIPLENIIIEPSCRDTAAAMSFATKYIANKHGEDETISMISSDHLIKNPAEFQATIQYAHQLAAKNDKITIVEVKASSPNPNFGYAKIGEHVKTENNIEVYELDHFTEKPNLELAKEYVQSYKYLWNTGLYTWKAKTLFNLLKKFSPETYNILNQITDFSNCLETYNQFPKISIDYALIEKMPSHDIWIIPADLGWSDIGNWETLYEELITHEDGNLYEGKTYQLDTHGSILINKEDNKKLCCINVNDLVIINTKDSILVCPKNECNSIKELLEKISNPNF